jgi:hypothetical protein
MFQPGDPGFPKVMDDHYITLNGLDINLRRLNDIQLDTIYRRYPDHVAVNAEWRSRKPNPPRTAPESQTSADGNTAIEATSSSAANAHWNETTSWDRIGTFFREAEEGILGMAKRRQIYLRQRPSQNPRLTSPFSESHAAPSLPEASRPSPLRQELVDLESSAEDRPSVHSSQALPRNSRMGQPHSWIQEFAAQNTMFNNLPAMNPVAERYPQGRERDNNCVLDFHNVLVTSPDGEADADEEDNVEEISRKLEVIHLEVENRERDCERAQEMDEGGYADDDDSSFEPAEPEYVFVSGNRQIGNVGSWNRLRAWNGTVRRGSRCPSPVCGGCGRQ